MYFSQIQHATVANGVAIAAEFHRTDYRRQIQFEVLIFYINVEYQHLNNL